MPAIRAGTAAPRATTRARRRGHRSRDRPRSWASSTTSLTNAFHHRFDSSSGAGRERLRGHDAAPDAPAQEAPHTQLVARELLLRSIAELARVRVHVDALDLGQSSGAEVEQRRRYRVAPNLEVAGQEAGERRRLWAEARASARAPGAREAAGARGRCRRRRATPPSSPRRRWRSTTSATAHGAAILAPAAVTVSKLDAPGLVCNKSHEIRGATREISMAKRKSRARLALTAAALTCVPLFGIATPAAAAHVDPPTVDRGCTRSSAIRSSDSTRPKGTCSGSRGRADGDGEHDEADDAGRGAARGRGRRGRA